jgi:hypothetical protein
MKTRDYVLVNARTMADSETYTKDLKAGSKIQYLRVFYQGTNGATSNTLAKLNGMVSKLEVTNGSDALHSLSMRQEQASNFFRHGRLPFQQLNSKAAGVVIEEAIINFGRFLGDREFYLDTSRYPNAQLSFTHALTISATAGFATTTGRLTVIARLIEEGALPCKGFIQSKQVANWTSLASGRHDLLLPLDYPIVALQAHDLVTTVEPDVDISNLKLSLDDDKFIPFDLTSAQLLYANIDEYGKAKQRMNFLNDTAVTWLSDIYGRASAFMGPMGGTAKGGISTVTAEQIVAYMTTGDTASLFINVEGHAPHSSLYYRFGDGINPDDFLLTSGIAKAELQVSEGGAGAADSIVVHQARS